MATASKSASSSSRFAELKEKRVAKQNTTVTSTPTSTYSGVSSRSAISSRKTSTVPVKFSNRSNNSNSQAPEKRLSWEEFSSARPEHYTNYGQDMETAKRMGVLDMPNLNLGNSSRTSQYKSFSSPRTNTRTSTPEIARKSAAERVERKFFSLKDSEPIITEEEELDNISKFKMSKIFGSKMFNSNNPIQKDISSKLKRMLK